MGRVAALEATRPERPWRARSIGRGVRAGTVAVATLGPLGSDPAERRLLATALLGNLVDLHDRGLLAPLPLACGASAAWAEAINGGKDPVVAATRKWEGSRDWPGENAEPAHLLAFGATLSLATLLLAEPAGEEAGDGWEAGEVTRFGRLARRLWDDILVMGAPVVSVDRPDFDVCGPLPTGLTLLEASAGTGKTFTIAALVARYIAEGVPIEDLLVVTFTRAATSELRDRVRQRLVDTEVGLRRAVAGGSAGGDTVLQLLAAGPEEVVSCRWRRVAAVLGEL